jgi:hypothetical protein
MKGIIIIIMSLQPSVLCWILAAFSVSLSYTQSVDSLDGGSTRRKASTCTQNNKKKQNKRTDIHALIGIRTRDPSGRVSEDGSCLSSHGHCDRHERDWCSVSKRAEVIHDEDMKWISIPWINELLRISNLQWKQIAYTPTNFLWSMYFYVRLENVLEVTVKILTSRIYRCV